MDENKIGCYRLLVASDSSQTSAMTLSAGATINSGSSASNVPHLYEVHRFRRSSTVIPGILENVYRITAADPVPGEWVLMEGKTEMYWDTLGIDQFFFHDNVALWHRYA